MSVLIGIIVVIVISYLLFTSFVDSQMDEMGLDEEEKEDAWWTIGMLADMHNKRNKK